MEFLLHFSYICSQIYENNETKEIELDSYLEKGQINENIGIYASYIDYVTSEAITKHGVNFYNENVKVTINVDSEIQKYLYY